MTGGVFSHVWEGRGWVVGGASDNEGSLSQLGNKSDITLLDWREIGKFKLMDLEE